MRLFILSCGTANKVNKGAMKTLVIILLAVCGASVILLSAMIAKATIMNIKDNFWPDLK